jgi:hypothetical protein
VVEWWIEEEDRGREEDTRTYILPVCFCEDGARNKWSEIKVKLSG